MTKQRGQAIVEFAFMTPLLFLFIFGMIYGALIFMDYLDFSNQARTEARKIAVMDQEKRKEKFAKSADDGTSSYSKAYETKFASFYQVTQTISLDPANSDKPTDVVVRVDFTRDNSDLPNVLRLTGFPPETIRPIEYRMKLEYRDPNS